MKTDIIIAIILCILLMFLPILGPLVIIILSFPYRKSRQYSGFYVFGFGILILHSLLILAIIAPEFKGREKVLDAEVKANVHTLQVGLERYKADHNYYPDHIEQIIEEKYFSNYPENPYTKKKLPMMAIPFGSQSFEGNFTYIPISSSKGIDNFILVGYGSGKKPGEDINKDGIPDHVIIVLTGKDVPLEISKYLTDQSSY